VSTPLCDNPEHIHRLCYLLKLGRQKAKLSPVFGGFHHRMWRLEADRGVYAVKQLAPDTDLNDPVIVKHYNVTETIARHFVDRGVAAQYALQSPDGHLQLIDDAGYLVYPWTDAVAIDKDQISETHALKVALLLAKMHLANIQVSGVTDASSDIVPEARITELIQLSVEHNLQHCTSLYEQLPALINISSLHRSALAFLARHLVVSHGDLDQKNVLWDVQGKPVVIDWESARKLNPTYEVVLEALDWSGITSNFDCSLFKKFISAYIHAGGKIDDKSIDAAFHCILGDWVDWLIYNVGRTVMLIDEDQRAIGAEQIGFTLHTIFRLEKMLPKLQSILRETASDSAILD
jgi:thiamine kinase-like enzyme